jgi:hypothetical protein
MMDLENDRSDCARGVHHHLFVKQSASVRFGAIPSPKNCDSRRERSTMVGFIAFDLVAIQAVQKARSPAETLSLSKLLQFWI